MNKKEAKKKIEKLREEINYHNQKYYIENNPVISDYEFDQLLKKLEKLETEFPDLITSDSPTQRIGEEPLEEFNTVEHKVPMLSLGNTYNYEELREFDERIKKNVGEDEYVVDLLVELPNAMPVELRVEEARQIQKLKSFGKKLYNVSSINVRTTEPKRPTKQYSPSEETGERSPG